MARLNEPPVNAESVEVVKRRFLRQNRELAKCNSNQSVRIRSLEQEISRLLAENLSLREQTIELQSQVEHHEQGPSSGHLATTRDLLEAKMLELGQLIAGIGNLPSRPPRTKPQPVATKKSSEERNWKNAYLQSDAMGGDGMLPTIIEDRYHPRRTLDAQEIKSLFVIGNMESPDLGPPPVAHFQDEDPIKCDLGAKPRRPITLDDSGDVQEIPDILPANLETRRRRRDSSSRRRSMFEPSLDDKDSSEAGTVSESNEQPRTGFKRKLSARDDDETAKYSSSDDFQFSRKNSTEPGAPSVTAKPMSNTTSTRKILGAKSTNATSPKKQANIGAKDRKPARDGKKDARTLSKGNENHELLKVNIPQPVEEPVLDIVEVGLDTMNLPPKTPAGVDDIFSPVSTEASATRPERRDGTPPPADLNGTSIDQQLNGRGSRRSRPQVSYAEPKLNVKMRRPGKELVDAVITKEARPSISFIKAEDAPSAPVTVEKLSMRTVVIKREREDDENDWRGFPQSAPEQRSPLSNKTASVSQNPSEELEKKKTESSKPSASGAAISALISNPPKQNHAPKSQPKPGDKTADKTVPKESDLAIFDFNESSPTTANEKPELPKARVESARARTARRHSLVSGIASTGTGTGTQKPSHTRSSSAGAKHVSITTEPKSQKAQTVLKDAKAAASSVQERAASRRRSMML